VNFLVILAIDNGLFIPNNSDNLSGNFFNGNSPKKAISLCPTPKISLYTSRMALRAWRFAIFAKTSPDILYYNNRG
jgi:hypothetical protein